MSGLAPKILEAQNRLHEQLEAAYGGYRLERDTMQESILWLDAPAALPTLVLRLKADPALRLESLSDITAYDNIDQVDGTQRFVVVVQLYSLSFHSRLRLKLLVGEEELVPSLTGIWPAANWLEREVFDLFGIRFAGHPDLRRILMDERFKGHPLRKEYDLKDRQPFEDSLPVRLAPHGPEQGRQKGTKI